LAAGFFAAVSFACFLPVMGISISFWPAAALRAFLAGFFSAFVSAATAWIPGYARRSGSKRLRKMSN
jgi:hypothetical protein